VQLIQAKSVIDKPQHKYECVKQSVFTHDNKMYKDHIGVLKKWAVAFAVLAKEIWDFCLIRLLFSNWNFAIMIPEFGYAILWVGGHF
jgi:hypothetical protein